MQRDLVRPPSEMKFDVEADIGREPQPVEPARWFQRFGIARFHLSDSRRATISHNRRISASCTTAEWDSRRSRRANWTAMSVISSKQVSYPDAGSHPHTEARGGRPGNGFPEGSRQCFPAGLPRPHVVGDTDTDQHEPTCHTCSLQYVSDWEKRRSESPGQPTQEPEQEQGQVPQAPEGTPPRQRQQPR